ncbi:MAG: Fic family protein [Candidatus Omnitrophica bacterium]|nr:Fic family protein [Candidatus Omnitrophota bacterium]
MNISQKLQIIQQITGLTQEKLAQKLGVSFPTVNSWINGKSLPHKKTQGRIDGLYYQCTGEKGEPAKDILFVKKNIVERKRQEYKNISNLVHKRPDLYDQFVLSLTYNTNRIEGSTLTEPETAAILFQDVALSNKTLVEQLEAKNHQTALQFLWRHCIEKKSVNEELILKMHSILLNGIHQDAGMYRTHGVRIVGANVPTANYMKVSRLMKGLFKDIKAVKKDAIAHCAAIHSRFEQVHPFSDGNGRIGRLLIHAMLLRQNLPPAVIKQEKKRKYISCLNRAQVKNDFVDLEEFICDAVLEGYKFIEQSL